MKNKSVDAKSIRAKYDLSVAGVARNQNFQKPEELHYIEVIEYNTEIDLPMREKSEDTSVVLSSPRRSPSKRAVKSEQKATPPTSSSTPAPKILNHLLAPKIVNNHRIDVLKCDLCSNTCSTKTAMDRHMRQLHSKGASSLFQCGVCSKTFAKRLVLQTHEKIHMNQRPTHECQYCGKILSSQTAVANHIKWIHTVNKEFECVSCLKLFATVSRFISGKLLKIKPNFSSQKGALKEHEKIHSAFKGHVCPLCKKSFKTASTLSQHLDTHGETEYHCSICDLRLNSKRTLRQHMVKHSDVTKFKCEICNAQFKRSKAYKEHLISIHTEIRAYKCDWCPKTFSNGANCRKHKKEAHPAELVEDDKKEKKKIVSLPKINELITMSLKNVAGK